ncbi:hypothetical protein LSTR_LSTR001569 [Laodelphax striatellus]|uniref:Odorant receptor n=1 Tax=Laodelphax striatellus TaxID=195883 RepID=A0A482XCU0_LAOST|nr:hypothetical protein LSTR_LSTR001569 [Laodelphax striatellus]
MSHECLSAIVAFFGLTPPKMKLILYFKNRQKAHKLDNVICKTLPLNSSDMEREGEKAIYIAVIILIWSSAAATLFALLSSNFLSLNREETSFLFPIYMPEFIERNSFTFYAVYGLQLLTCTHVVAINGSTLASFAHASNVLCVQNKNLGIAICNLTVDHGTRAISNERKQEKMKEYVEFHSHLVKYDIKYNIH